MKWPTWATIRSGGALNLLAPDVLVEAHIHILASGDSKMYVSKIDPATTPNDMVRIVTLMLDNVMSFAKQHNVQVSVKQEGPS